MKNRFGMAGILLLAGILWLGPAWANETIKLGVVTKPGFAQNVCAGKFKDLLESRSSYKVHIYHSNSLGNETEILKKIQNNAVQMGVITSSIFDDFVPETQVIDYPFLFESHGQADRILDGAPGRELLSRLEKAGFKGLAFSENGFRHLTNNIRPVHSVADVAGLKIRVMESVLQKELWKLLGTDPIPLPWPINAALRKKTVDGQENPLTVIWNARMYKLQKYLTLTGHVYSPHIDVANLKWFNGLPAADRDLIETCMREAARHERQWSRDNASNVLAKLKKAGMKVDEKPDLASFRNRVAGIKDLDRYQDKDTRDLLQKFLTAVENDSKM